MRRFWIEFDLRQPNLPSNLAAAQARFGVTALDQAEALALIQEHIFPNGLPTTSTLVEDVDVSTLDGDHVLPNMGNVMLRGIWFPLGSTPESRLCW